MGNGVISMLGSKPNLAVGNVMIAMMRKLIETNPMGIILYLTYRSNPDSFVNPYSAKLL